MTHWACQFCQIVIGEDEEPLANLAPYLLKSLSRELLELLLQVAEHILNPMHVWRPLNDILLPTPVSKPKLSKFGSSGVVGTHQGLMRRWWASSSIRGQRFFFPEMRNMHLWCNVCHNCSCITNISQFGWELGNKCLHKGFRSQYLPGCWFHLPQLWQAEEGQHWERGSARLGPNSEWW